MDRHDAGCRPVFAIALFILPAYAAAGAVESLIPPVREVQSSTGKLDLSRGCRISVEGTSDPRARTFCGD